MAAYRPDRRPLLGWDVVLSAVVLAGAALAVALGVVAGVFSVAFLDDCRPERCSAGGAVVAVGGAVVVAAGVGIGGLAVVVRRIVRRRASWPYSVVALVLCLGVLAGGAVAYRAAVGG